MPTQRIHDVDLYYEEHGVAGEPLVLVHGYTGDITDWRLQLPDFSRSHRLLIMDHRGHGRSSAPPDRSSYSIEQMSRDVEALVAHVGFERYHLLGHSMGGSITQEIALRSPGRLMSLTLQDTSPTFRLRGEIVQKYNEMRCALADAKGMAAVAELPSPTPAPPHSSPERQAEMKARLANMAADAFVGAFRGLQEWPGTEDRAKDIPAPTLVICGDLDASALIKSARWFAKTIPGAALEMIPEAAHSPQYERPDQFNAALRRHLERNMGAGSK